MISKTNFFSFKRISATVLITTLIFGAPASAFAALEVSGWIPYWRTEQGAADARKHIEQFTEVNPFAYSVKSDGSLADTAKIDQAAWKRLIKDADRENVRVVPTVMWSDTENIHSILSNPTSRARHIKAIADMVKQNDFDGADIDYEGKKAETRDAYSSFLRELSIELKKGGSPKWLQCTIEARMPLEARFSGTPPANIEYANDLKRVNQYCDRVRIMTYDQQTADIQLNRKHAGEPYGPVSDAEWVEKVVNYMDNDIDRGKMVLGIPTYGNIYQLMANTSGTGFSYIKLEAFNPKYGHDIAEEYDLEPSRGESGELELTYVPKSTSSSLPSQKDLARLAPRDTESAYLAAEGALAYAKKERKQAPVTYLTWSDEGAIKEKVELAERLKVAGIAIFKIDGGLDSGMWDVLPDEAPKLLKAPKGNPGSPVVTTPVPAPIPAPIPTPTPGTSYSFKSDLEFGMENADVRKLQNILVAKGYLKATPNGYFGPATKEAVAAWQRANGLPGTGFFGPQSRTKMGVSQ
ncbi:MAG: spore germination protein [Candidatus Parcubacteria bacterium]|jgi:spore germination protein YaaH|nr:spore germination protein [Candidatus Parcubacteria bacterium]